VAFALRSRARLLNLKAMPDPEVHPAGETLDSNPSPASEPAPNGGEASSNSPKAAVPEEPLAAPVADRRSAMAPRFNFVFRWFARRFFSHFQLDPQMVSRLQDLESRGTIVYVMRYSSRLDYFLFNTLFARTGLRLSSFANGLHFYYYRPFLEAMPLALQRKRGRPKEIEHGEDQEAVRGLLSGPPASLFLFLRTARLSSSLMTPRSRRRQDELDLVEEVIRTSWDSDKPVFVVPLALFWRKGPRTPNRFLNLFYGSATRPSDLAKVASFLATYRSLSVKIGDPIAVREFIAEQRSDGPQRVARKVRRMILIYLYREEKVVEGPTLRPPHRVFEQVLADPGVQAAIATRAEEKHSVQRAEADAEKMFREIAANMNSTFLAVLGAIVGWLFRRLFASIDVTGLERVAGYAKRNPIVLVPNHRSYFDFLILSWLFYMNFLVPPHILARENMAFGPFGFLFRRAGAFFMRASMDDPLYKQLFRAYVAYLVREGFTQEFFIEGGRSRTGKTSAPRFGKLSWDVEAFVPSARRDLFYVPIAITYERLVEESTMVDELQGGAKTKESVAGLVRARKYLQRRFGSVHVSFGEPISLAAALGEKRVRFAGPDSESLLAEKRVFVEQLGHRIVERINWAAVANATSVAACVMLGSRHRGLRRDELVERMQEVVALLRLQDVRLTAALLRDEGDFEDSIAFLLRSDLLKRIEEPRGEILYYEVSHQRALDLYRNSIVHYLAAPSFLARRLLRGATMKELREDLATWQDLLYQEFFAPRAEVLAAHCEGFLDHFERSGWITHQGDTLQASERGEPRLRYLAEQTRGVIEAYAAACSAIAEVEGEVTAKELRKLAEQHFRNAELLGEAQRSEAANDSTFSNLADLLVRSGILTSSRVAVRRGTETQYARGERWDSLGELRERLAVALSGQ
jgi:glycerol-3-phosphate O-acyltransferase